MKLKSIIISSCLLTGALTSCSGYFDVIDTNVVNQDQVSDVLERTPTAIIYGIYSRSYQYAFDASSHDDFGQRSMDISCDIMTEDIVHYSNQQWFVFDYNLGNRASTYRRARRQWKYNYANIADANTIINSIPDEETNQTILNLKGEALALRAHSYFMLINLFQTAGNYNEVKSKPGVPIYTELNLNGAPRGTVEDVYKQINTDLDKAITLLEGEKYDKTRVGQRVATLMRARSAMYMADYAKAEECANNVLTGIKLMTPTEYQGGFYDIKSMSECLYGALLDGETSTKFASFFSIMDNYAPGYAGALKQYKCIDRRLYDNINSNDARKGCFAGADGLYSSRLSEEESGGKVKNLKKLVPYTQAKFLDIEGNFLADYTYMRVAEAYYIKAEAQARQGNEVGAKTTLDIISNARALTGVHQYVWKSGQELLDQIFVQYRIENWGEGMILFEYNRLKKTIDRTYEGSNHPVANIETGDHPISWGDPLRTIQIPTSELEGNPQISDADQNP